MYSAGAGDITPTAATAPMMASLDSLITVLSCNRSEQEQDVLVDRCPGDEISASNLQSWNSRKDYSSRRDDRRNGRKDAREIMRLLLIVPFLVPQLRIVRTERMFSLASGDENEPRSLRNREKDHVRRTNSHSLLRSRRSASSRP